MNVATNFYTLKKSFDRIHVYLVLIYPAGSENPTADDEKLTEHERYQIVKCGGSPAVRRRKNRLLKELLSPPRPEKPNSFFLFDNHQHFVIGEKVESVSSDQFEDGMVVLFKYQNSLDLDGKPVIKQEDESKGDECKEQPVTSSTEPTRLLNLINRYRLLKANFTRLSRRGTSWFDERSQLVYFLVLYIS